MLKDLGRWEPEAGTPAEPIVLQKAAASVAEPLPILSPTARHGELLGEFNWFLPLLTQRAIRGWRPSVSVRVELADEVPEGRHARAPAFLTNAGPMLITSRLSGGGGRRPVVVCWAGAEGVVHIATAERYSEAPIRVGKLTKVWSDIRV